jgi:hypothetical protein
MGIDSNGTSEYKRWFKGGRHTVYEERIVCCCRISCLLLVTWSLAYQSGRHLWRASISNCLDPSIQTANALLTSLEDHILIPVSPVPDPSHHNGSWNTGKKHIDCITCFGLCCTLSVKMLFQLCVIRLTSTTTSSAFSTFRLTLLSLCTTLYLQSAIQYSRKQSLMLQQIMNNKAHY